ncbi:10564_t:CDS:2, partial [Dentiscutata erythropus]
DTPPKLIEFLRNQELNLDDEDFSCLRSQKISGSNFLLLKRRDLIDCKLKVGSTVTLLNLIAEINTTKSLRKFREYNEVAFQTTVELLLPTKHWCSKLRLVIDSSKISGEGRFGFIDIFVNEVNGNGLNSSIILELKCISLVGLLSGEEGR